MFQHATIEHTNQDCNLPVVLMVVLIVSVYSVGRGVDLLACGSDSHWMKMSLIGCHPAMCQAVGPVLQSWDFLYSELIVEDFFLKP